MSECDYEYIRKITKTTKSNIWLCKQRINGEHVVIKELIRSEITNPQSVWNERDILQKLTQLKYSKSPKLLDTFKSQNSLFFILQLIPGSPLNIFYPFSIEITQLIFSQIINIIKYLHSLGIVYRDIKLSNFILVNSTVYICDFGHAKDIGISGKTSSECGTLHAMAPEIGSKEYGFEVDFWALGILLYELIEGKSPFGYGKRAREFNIKFDHTKHRNGSLNLIQKLLDPNPNTRLTDWEYLSQHEFCSHVLTDWRGENGLDYIFGKVDDIFANF